MDCVRLQSFAPSRRPCLIDIFKHEASTAVAQSEHNVYIHNYNIFSYGMKMTEKKTKIMLMPSSEHFQCVVCGSTNTTETRFL